MGRGRRNDEPGAWHHVMNRAIARRPLFETERDLRYFLSRLAREVRRGRLEVHAWCLMTTHFHLLVRSRTGEMAEGLRRIQNEYVRYFNRAHRRDGTLVRGRFRSKRVRGLAYRHLLVRYIDANPVQARMCARPWEYPWGSAADHVRPRARPWLARDWIGTVLADQLESGLTRLEAYRTCFSPHVSDAARVMFQGSFERQRAPLHSEIDLVLDAPDRVLAWMERKARPADGVSPSLRLADLSTVQRHVDDRLRRSALEGGSALGERPSRVLTVAALRSLASATWHEIGGQNGIARSSAQRLFTEEHRDLFRSDRAYRAAFEEITRSLVAEIVS